MIAGAVLHEPESRLRVVSPDVGGGFGVKINHPWPEELLVPLAARLLGSRGVLRALGLCVCHYDSSPAGPDARPNSRSFSTV
mgnify:CR=1 FL=1